MPSAVSDTKTMSYNIHPVRPEEAERTAQLEQECFPPDEAESIRALMTRMEAAPQLYLVAVHAETGQIAGYLNGIATDETSFRDEFFTDFSLWRSDGKNIALLGLAVEKSHRGRGVAHQLMNAFIDAQRKAGRQSLMLTCHEEKVPLYEGFGFKDLGLSGSSWGGQEWHEMRLTL